MLGKGRSWHMGADTIRVGIRELSRTDPPQRGVLMLIKIEENITWI
ncbi:hypothetical protein CIPAW_13G154500 [Carya illinoinensis]|uniref:Uncharacterized protein n=1 Tax=Carya illinoinensis TaxID=32201 RepID=A0A8T1NPR2_CARIL|nr:hypothetical protein CIPAW_13G154500 [Carya illinoinensis]